jgi:ATP-binding cassette subfamily B protein
MSNPQGKVSGKAFDYVLFKRIFSYTKPYNKLFVSTILATVILAFVSPIRPILIQYAFDHYIVSYNMKGLINLSLLMIVLLIAESILQFYSSYFTNVLGQNVIRDMRSQLLRHINTFRLRYFDKNPIGTLVTRTVSDIQTIADVFSQGFLEIIGDILKLVIIIAVMFYTDWRLSLISLSTIPVLLVATYIFKNAIKSAFQQVRTQVAKLNAFVQEHITGMAVVQLFNREKRELVKFKEINGLHRDAHVRSVWHYSVFFPIVEILSAISIGLIVWFGAREALEDKVSIGVLIAFIMYINMLFRPIRQLADRFNTLQMGMVGSERVFKILDTEDHIKNSGTITANSIEGNIDFKNVWFAYADDNYVLKDISFSIRAGETLALVGSTGSGKSSIVNLVNRFYEYNKGEVIIDGINVRDYELNSLRSNIAFVLQDVFLFSDTVFNNITLNNKDVSLETVIEASKIVGAHEFITRLPGGYDFNVMERGGMLSVGQRQLISFVRAYVYNPRILILDEATSSIDSEAEKMIQHATSVLTKGRTSIIIAHRLSTIQKADKIIVMSLGEVVEEGSHFELLNNNGYYKRLFDMQFKQVMDKSA